MKTEELVDLSTGTTAATNNLSRPANFAASSEVSSETSTNPAGSLERQLDQSEKWIDLALGDTPLQRPIELSIVIPCLNEADTVATCVRKALRAIDELGIAGEVIVADNGSTDGSRELAESAGARLVPVAQRGYGSALMGGIAAARGEFVIMGDADDSYDFTQIRDFYEKLKAGIDLVQGCRLPSGGGTVKPGAMPFLHRWVGNPILSALVRTMFSTNIHDVYCGLRGFKKSWQQSLDQRCTGMEFATEMIIKSTLFGAAIDQVPITLHRDGRISSRSHLRTFRDGWRTLRFFMLLSPRWTFMVPGLLFASIGLILCCLALPQARIGRIALDVHTLLVGVLSLLIASQTLWCGILARTFATTEGLLPKSQKLDRLFQFMSLERLLIGSCAMIGTGVAMIASTVALWATEDFGALNYASTMRMIIPATGLITLGFQCAASSFLLSVLRMARL